MIGYKRSVEWIALNDDPGLSWSEHEIVTSQLTVVLVADQFDKTPEQVAADVLKKRARIKRAMQTSE